MDFLEYNLSHFSWESPTILVFAYGRLRPGNACQIAVIAMDAVIPQLSGAWSRARAADKSSAYPWLSQADLHSEYTPTPWKHKVGVGASCLRITSAPTSFCCCGIFDDDICVFAHRSGGQGPSRFWLRAVGLLRATYSESMREQQCSPKMCHVTGLPCIRIRGL